MAGWLPSLGRADTSQSGLPIHNEPAAMDDPASGNQGSPNSAFEEIPMSTSPAAAPVTLAPPVSVSRPSPARSNTLQIPQQSGSFINQNQGGPASSPPLSPSSPNGQTPVTPVKRNRAHTVSVSMRRRGPTVSSQRSTDVPAPGTSSSRDGTGRSRKGSIMGYFQGDTPTSASRPKNERASSLLKSSVDPSRRGSQGQAGGRRRSGSTVSVEVTHTDGHTEDLDDDVVGMLDVIDPHVSTVNHLQNMSNTLIFPHFPSLWSRRPEVVLPHVPSEEEISPLAAAEEGQAGTSEEVQNRSRSGTRRTSVTRPRASTVSKLFPPSPSVSTPTRENTAPFARLPESPTPGTQRAERSATLQSRHLSPHEMEKIGEAREEDELNDDVDLVEKDHELDAHVKRVLKRQKKKEKAKAMLAGLWTYLKTPMGVVTAIYGFLVVFWGAAIVLFLLGWIPTNSKNTQDIWVEISSQVVNGLFTVTGVGLIPWRVTDAFRMYEIWRLKRLTIKRRAKQGLPPIEDPNDLPDPRQQEEYVSVLNEKEQQQLDTHQQAFAKSQTWYKPHATATHKAYPISYALANTFLMVGNSAFQCILCGCMWGLNRHERPAWTTGSLIPLSFLCGIGAAVAIWRGSVTTKKTISVEEKLREALGVPLAVGGVGEKPKAQKKEDGEKTRSDAERTPTPTPSEGKLSRHTAANTEEEVAETLEGMGIGGGRGPGGVKSSQGDSDSNSRHPLS